MDANQQEVCKALEQIGCDILYLHRLGKGKPDILAGRRNVNLLLEIKDGSKPPSRQRLTKHEKEFHNTWRGQRTIVSSVKQAVDYVLENS